MFKGSDQAEAILQTIKKRLEEEINPELERLFIKALVSRLVDLTSSLVLLGVSPTNIVKGIKIFADGMEQANIIDEKRQAEKIAAKEKK